MRSNKSNYKSIAHSFILIAFVVFLSTFFVIVIFPKINVLFLDVKSGRIASVAIIVSILSSILLLFIRIVSHQWRVTKPSLPLFAYMLISFSVNAFAKTELTSDYRWLLSSIALPLLYISLSGYKLNQRQIIILLKGLIFIMSIIVLFLTFTDANGVFPSLDGIFKSRYRVYMFGDQYGPITLSTIASTLFILVLGSYLLLIPKSTLSRFICIVIMFLSAISMLVSGGRTAWIGTLFSLIILTLLSTDSRSAKMTNKFGLRKRYLATLIILVFVISVVIESFASQEVIQRITNLPNVLKDPIIDRSLSTRIKLWGDAIKIGFKDLSGWGFDYYIQKNRLTVHNEYIHVFLGSGIIGIFFYFAFYIYNCSIVYKAINRTYNDINRNILIIIFSCLIHISVISLGEAWSYSNTFAAVIFWVIFSLGPITSRAD